MNLNQFLADLEERGVKLWADGGQLHIRAPKGVLTKELRQGLGQRKADILRWLQGGQERAQALPTVVPAPEERDQPFPLNDIQQAYWLGRQELFELGNVAPHAYLELECDGLELDLPRLSAAWQQLIERHEMLRAVVLPTGEQKILEQIPSYEIEVYDLEGNSPALVEAELLAIRDRMSHQVFSPEQWPLFEIRATRYAGRVRLHISLDVLMTDVASVLHLFQEWEQLYQNPNTFLTPLSLSFRDYLLAEKDLEKSDLYQRSRDYWFNRLDTLPPAPELPLAQNLSQLASPNGSPRFKRHQGQLSPELWLQLKQRATKVGLTSSTVLLAALSEVLAAWSKNQRFTINLTLFNRLPLHAQVNEIVGDFTTLTLLAVDHSAPSTFIAHAKAVQRQLWQDLDHRYVSGVRVLRELVRRQSGTQRAVMPVVFTSTLGLEVEGCLWTSQLFGGEVVYSISQTPQVWLDHQVFEQDGTLLFNWDVLDGIFPEGLLDDMFGAYCHLLTQLASDESAWRSTYRQLIPSHQLEQRAAINATGTPISDQMLHTLFMGQVERSADKVAVISPQRTLTYRELYEQANQVGHKLRQLGAKPNTLVAVVMEKGWEQIVAVLGILMSGAAYLPIDPKLPAERRQYLFEQGEVQVALTQSTLNQSLEWPLDIDDNELKRLCIPTDFVEMDKSPLPSVQSHEDLAYVIYTSGSTGLPKGVAIDHRGAVNTVLDINQRFEVGPNDRVLALSALNFDLSVYDIFGLLAVGGTIVMPEARLRKDPAHWAELMVRHQVTLWDTVPALMQMLVEYLENRSLAAPLRLVMMSGDWIPVNLPDKIRLLFEDAQLMSLGGATEASIWSIYYPIGEVDPSWKSIPYGKPMTNQSFHVLNDLMEPRPVWVPGQLYIGGIGLAKEYWRDEEKTNARFIIHPHTGERLYKTGDLGRYLPDGNIEFLGREDFQVKIRGHRIELGEIEANLLKHPVIKKTVVMAVGTRQGNKELIAYLVPDLSMRESLFEVQRLETAEVQRRWQSILTTGESQRLRLSWDPTLQRFLTFKLTLDRLYLNALCQTLRKLGVYTSAGERYNLDQLMSRCQIVPRYRKWLRRALLALVEAGWLEQQGEYFESVTPLPTITPQQLSADIIQSQKAGHNEITARIHLHTAQNLADLITERMHSAQIYASDETPLIYQELFSSANALARDVIKRIVGSISEPLRILEVGAGYGSTTVQLLPLLPKSASYTFTDISDFFLDRAKKEFANYPFVRYAQLDLEQDPVTQGYEPHSFDIVVASSVLHVPHKIEETLQHVLKLLAPGGLLLMIEETDFHPFFDLGMGLQQGFERFSDSALRPLHPLLSREQWPLQLAKAGFEDSIVLNQPGTIADSIGIDIIVAQGPSSVARPALERLREFLGQKVPDYMVPNHYVLLDALPLTANGKIDRKALPKANTRPSTPEIDYAPPQTEIEQTMAEIVGRVLNLDAVGIHNNFFDLGADSLYMVKIQRQLNQALGKEVPLVEMFNNPTISSLANYLSSSSSANNTPVSIPSPPISERAVKAKEFQQRRKKRRQKRRGS